MERPNTQINYTKYMKEKFPHNSEYEIMNQLVLYIKYLESMINENDHLKYEDE